MLEHPFDFVIKQTHKFNKITIIVYVFVNLPKLLFLFVLVFFRRKTNEIVFDLISIIFESKERIQIYTKNTIKLTFFKQEYLFNFERKWYV